MENTPIEQLAIIGRRNYYKQYREKNKAKIAEYRKNYFAKKAALANEQPNEENHAKPTDDQ